MSTIRSGLDELRTQDLDRSSDEELAEDLVELERASRVMEAERGRRLVEVERRGSWALDGHLSVVSWLAARLRIGAGRASRHLRLARALHRMPVAAEALASGELSAEAAGLLVSAREAAPETFAGAEAMLVEAARSLPARELRAAIGYWRQAADAAGERARRLFEGRRLHVSPMLDGIVRVDGELDPEAGQGLITALRSVEDAWTRGGEEDERTAPQRRADALGELCRAWLDSPGRPRTGGERPHVVAVVDLEALAGRLGRRCELEDAGPISPEAARRLACDAGLSRVIAAGASEPLEIGRKSPVVPAAMRRALALRDGGCRFPGCGRPQGWCDAHHVRHWADGGETGLGNLVLLCRPHHRAVHEGFGVQMAGGRPVFTRADGSRLEERAPP